jgi:HTH-type transcriptional regulator / antitoxin HipB
MDNARTLLDIGTRVRDLRKTQKITTEQIALKSGRSRDVLNRLERGKDISLSSLLAILEAMGHAIAIVRVGEPTLEEMRKRFARDVDEDT